MPHCRLVDDLRVRSAGVKRMQRAVRRGWPCCVWCVGGTGRTLMLDIMLFFRYVINSFIFFVQENIFKNITESLTFDILYYEFFISTLQVCAAQSLKDDLGRDQLTLVSYL